jgi:hypothetical protein
MLRQLVAAQRTILHAAQSEIVEANLSRRFGARIPDRAVNGRTIGAAGISINRRPAACASVAVRQKPLAGKQPASVAGSVHRLLLVLCRAA